MVVFALVLLQFLTIVYCPEYQRMCANKLTAVSAVTRVALFASMA